MTIGDGRFFFPLLNFLSTWREKKENRIKDDKKGKDGETKAFHHLLC
jgi:hypothetical protein